MTTPIYNNKDLDVNITEEVNSFNKKYTTPDNPYFPLTKKDLAISSFMEKSFQ